MTAFSTRKQILGLIGWLALSFATSAIGAIASVQAGAFYTSLDRAAWAPPASVFGPVWTALYALMGIAAWLCWRQGGWRLQRKPLTLFIIQLGVNAIWSWLFFVWHLGALSVADIALLWVLIVATLVGFWRATPLAGALLLPYLAWVSFAGFLCYSVWQRNPQVLG